jgi:hypothetical protein
MNNAEVNIIILRAVAGSPGRGARRKPFGRVRRPLRTPFSMISNGRSGKAPGFGVTETGIQAVHAAEG